MTAWLNPYRWLLLAALVAAMVLGYGAWASHQRDIGREEVRAEMAAAAAAQAERNRELQRAAELRYVVQAGVRDRFITQIVKEVHHAAAPLADCPVPEPVRVRINAASACVRDPEAACDVLDGVPGP